MQQQTDGRFWHKAPSARPDWMSANDPCQFGEQNLGSVADSRVPGSTDHASGSWKTTVSASDHLPTTGERRIVARIAAATSVAIQLNLKMQQALADVINKLQPEDTLH